MTQKRILVVDDAEDITLTFKLVLEGAGFLVDTFNDPNKVLKDFKNGFYDLSFIDIQLGGENMNGFQLVNELQKIDKSLTVCFITGFKSYYDSLISEYPNIDHKCFMQKPISNQDLIKRVQEIFQE